MDFQPNSQTRYTLLAGDLTAVISPIGGELLSLKVRDTELIWQGDPAYWEGSAPLLFPFCGRVKDGIYRWEGRDYPIPIHGFLPTAMLTPTEISAHHLTLVLTDTPESRTLYPFSFRLTLTYRLDKKGLSITAMIEAGDSPLLFSFGAHPGFNLPCTANGFANASLRFDTPSSLSRVEITEEGLLGNCRRAYPLQDSLLPLSPDPAGGCGIFFEVPQEQRALTLSSPDLPCDIRMDFADFPVLGLWHAEGAPYLCIEPWQGLPAPADRPTELASKPATLFLAPHEAKPLHLRISLSQKG